MSSIALVIHAINAAAKVDSLERLALSSLQNASKWSKRKDSHVYHFEYKAQVAKYAAETYLGLWAKTSVFRAGWFLSNYITNPLAQPVYGSRALAESHPRQPD